MGIVLLLVSFPSMSATAVRRSLEEAAEASHRGIVKILIDDQYSKLYPEREDVLRDIQKEFCFLSPNFWFVKSKSGPSSFRSRFATQTSFITERGRFPTGLLEEIETKLQKMNVTVQRQDTRKFFYECTEYEPVTSDIFASENPNLTLHDYQVDVANLALEKKQGIIKCATGGGKTMIFTSILKALGGRYPAMMICRNKSVVNQTYEAFRTQGLENVGRVHMDYIEPDIITCITAQSLHKVLPLIPRTKVVLVDEVHEWASKQSQKSLKMFTNATYKLGFSATPWNQDPIHDYKIMSFTGPQLCDIGIDYLRNQEILSSCHAHFYRIKVPSQDQISSANILRGSLNMLDTSQSKRKFAKPIKSNLSSTTEFPLPVPTSVKSFLQSDNIGIVENENLQQKIVEIVSNISEGRILILVRRLSHGDRLKELMPEAHWIRGQDNAETREYVLQQLRHSESKKVVAIMSAIGFYGLNVLCHHLINACGGKDANLLIQKVGRGLRKGIDKDHLEYHDFIFEGDKFLSRHSKNRIDVLKQEGHTVTIH